MSPAKALPTGLGIVSEGLELRADQLPHWEESKVKVLPMVRVQHQTNVSVGSLSAKRFGKIL